MIDGVCNVPFVDETAADDVVANLFGMQDLDRDAVLVAMYRLVHGCHAADTENAFEFPAVAQHLAEPALDTSDNVFGNLHAAQAA
jgi:hypothetical protein